MSIINPLTNRCVKIGSKVWKHLINQGLIDEDGINDDTKIVANIQDDDEEEIELKRQEALKKIDKEIYTLKKGKGFYKDNLVKEKRKPTQTSTYKKEIERLNKKIDKMNLKDKKKFAIAEKVDQSEESDESEESEESEK